MTDWGESIINAEFGGAAKGLGKAQKELAEAAEHADQAAARMAAGQLHGVATGIGAIKTKLEQDHAQIGSVSGSIAPLSTAVGKITSHSTPDEVTATLAPVKDRISGVVSASGQASVALRATDALIRRNLKGGKPDRLLAYVTRANSILDAVRKQLDQAAAATDRSLKQAKEAGDTGK